MELQGQRFFVGLLFPCGNHNESRPCPMLTLACIDALLVNENLAVLVGEAHNAPDSTAYNELVGKRIFSEIDQ